MGKLRDQAKAFRQNQADSLEKKPLDAEEVQDQQDQDLDAEWGAEMAKKAAASALVQPQAPSQDEPEVERPAMRRQDAQVARFEANFRRENLIGALNTLAVTIQASPEVAVALGVDLGTIREGWKKLGLGPCPF